MLPASDPLRLLLRHWNEMRERESVGERLLFMFARSSHRIHAHKYFSCRCVCRSHPLRSLVLSFCSLLFVVSGCVHEPVQLTSALFLLFAIPCSPPFAHEFVSMNSRALMLMLLHAVALNFAFRLFLPSFSRSLFCFVSLKL